MAPFQRSVVHVWQGPYPWEVRVGKLNRALQGAGLSVTVVARAARGQKAMETVDGVTIRRVGAGLPRLASLPLPGNPLWVSAIVKAVRESGAGLILVRDIPLAPSAAVAARLTGARLVLDMAEHYPAAMRSWKKYNENALLYFLVHGVRVPDAVERAALRSADGVLVVCDEMKDRLTTLGMDPALISVVRNTPELPLPPTDGARRGPWADGTFVFGYHGILCADRRLDAVIEGFALALKEEPGLRLLLAGGGEMEKQLKALAQHLKLGEAITFTGRYSPEALPALYAAADAGIVSLEDNEFTRTTLANKFFDYAARATPFIYSELPPLTRLMATMACGLGFEAENPESVAQAMVALSRKARHDGEGFRAMGEKGRELVNSTYNWRGDSERALELLGRVEPRLL
jgi:glycosyltransferase involved in cell wall biosynthesis